MNDSMRKTFLIVSFRNLPVNNVIGTLFIYKCLYLQKVFYYIFMATIDISVYI